MMSLEKRELIMVTGILKTRQGLVESQHLLEWGIMDAFSNGKASQGFVQQGTYLRSSFKPFQTVALSQALFEADSEYWKTVPSQAWVIASASHSGDVCHLEWVNWWLEQAGFSAEEASNLLLCGGHVPMSGTNTDTSLATENLSLFHNCSGQHAMILKICQILGWSTENYTSSEHPCFRTVVHALEKLLPRQMMQWGVDGCRLPTPYLTLQETLHVMNQFSQTDAGHVLLKSMKTHPLLVAGVSRFDSVIGALEYPIVSKIGAEGLLVAWHLERKETLVIKSISGDSAMRDRFAWHVMAQHSWLPQEVALTHSPLLDNSPYATVQSDLQVLI